MPEQPRDYEHYDSVSSNYDATRRPVGLEVIFGCLSKCTTTLDGVRLISLGCGTGNYEVELARRVGSVYGIDISQGMIAQARRKVGASRNLDFAICDAIRLDGVDDDTFDAALFNQSLHHIGGFEQQRQALTEAYRVLNHRGVVVLQTCSQRQLMDSFWWLDLIPEAAKKQAKKLMPLPELINMLGGIGFSQAQRIVPVDAVVQSQGYLNIDGVFDEEWRAGDSSWSLTTQEELGQAQERVRRMKREGTLQDWVDRRERLRQDIGQITFVYAVKK